LFGGLELRKVVLAGLLDGVLVARVVGVPEVAAEEPSARLVIALGVLALLPARGAAPQGALPGREPRLLGVELLVAGPRARPAPPAPPPGRLPPTPPCRRRTPRRPSPPRPSAGGPCSPRGGPGSGPANPPARPPRQPSPPCRCRGRRRRRAPCGRWGREASAG